MKPEVPRAVSFALDVTTVVKACQALSSEIALDTLMMKLMKILFENAGAQRGILILDSMAGS